MNNNRRGWWIVVEGVAIVASILLAFIIEAWWSDRQERIEEESVLQSVLLDLQYLKELLAGDRVFNQAILESTVTLINAHEEPDVSIPQAELDILIGNTGNFNLASEWDSPAFRMLLEGGGLEELSDPELRYTLARLHVMIERLQELYKMDAEFTVTTWASVMLSDSKWAQLVAAEKHLPGFPDRPMGTPGTLRIASNFDHSALLTRRDLQNLFVVKMLRIRNILNFAYSGLDTTIDDAISSVEEALSNG